MLLHNILQTMHRSFEDAGLAADERGFVGIVRLNYCGIQGGDAPGQALTRGLEESGVSIGPN